MDFTTFGSNSNKVAAPLNLSKGSVLDLTKQAPSLKRCVLGGGWDMAVSGPTADLDLAAFLIEENGRVTQVPHDVIFFNNMQAPGIFLEGDNRTGAGEGDDERIQIDLDAIERRIHKIVFFISIFDAVNKRQTFGMIKNAFVRLLDAEDGEREICRYELSSDYSADTVVTACSLTRTANGWSFEAIGEGLIADLNQLLTRYM